MIGRCRVLLRSAAPVLAVVSLAAADAGAADVEVTGDTAFQAYEVTGSIWAFGIKGTF